MTKRVLDIREAKGRWTNLGAFALTQSPERTKACVLALRRKWEQVAAAAKIEPE